MAIVKEFICLAHGDFDSTKAVCPHGCKGEIVQRVFRTAPSIQSRGFKITNDTFESLAREQGVSNLRNSYGESMRKADHDTYKRLDHANELVMTASKSGMVGQDASQYFKPLNNFQMGSTGGGAIQKVGDQVMAGGIPLNRPRADVVSAFDGRDTGLPAGDL